MGVLGNFLLEKGKVKAKRFAAVRKYGLFVSAFAIAAPIVNGCVVAFLSGCVTSSTGNRFMLAILAAMSGVEHGRLIFVSVQLPVLPETGEERPI